MRVCRICGLSSENFRLHSRQCRLCELQAKRKPGSPPRPRGTMAERFWPKVEKSEGCWLWRGSTNSDGYGTIKGNGSRVIKATHASWEIHYGPLHPGNFVLHSCDNPPCVNPDHLFEGTHLDNMADMVAKGRIPHIYGRRPAARLSEAQIAAIRSDSRKQKLIALDYGVADSTISHIKTGKTWRGI